MTQDSKTAVDQVGDRKIDQSVLAAEGNSRFGPVDGQGHEAFTFAAGENDAEHGFAAMFRRGHGRIVGERSDVGCAREPLL